MEVGKEDSRQVGNQESLASVSPTSWDWPGVRRCCLCTDSHWTIGHLATSQHCRAGWSHAEKLVYSLAFNSFVPTYAHAHSHRNPSDNCLTIFLSAPGTPPGCVFQTHSLHSLFPPSSWILPGWAVSGFLSALGLWFIQTV